MRFLSLLPSFALVAPFLASPQAFAKRFPSSTWSVAPSTTPYKDYKDHSQNRPQSGAYTSQSRMAQYGEGEYHKPKKHKSKSKSWGGIFPTLNPSGSGYNNPSGFGTATGTGTGTGGFPGPTQPSFPPGPSGGATKPPVSTPSDCSNGTVISSGGINLPAGCSQKNGIGIGWLPSDVPLSQIESLLGSTSCWDGQYSQITDNGAYTDASHQLLGHVNDISSGGQTIFVASIQPTIPFSQVDSVVCQGVASVLAQFTDRGIEVWLRYAHEMNYYTESNSQGGHYTGTAAEFQTSWEAMSAAMKSNPKIKMFWSPNSASPDSLQQWYPKSGQVDIVGIDIYPKKQQSFGETYGAFCKAFSSAQIPFVIGETGAGPDLKEFWLGQLVSADAKSACPYYLGFSWFEYNKEEDFRVVTGGDDIAKGILG